MKPTPVSIRKSNATGRLELFFINSNTRREWWLECFDPRDGHIDVPREYMQRKTKPTRPADDGVMRLCSQWAAIGPDETLVRLVHKLTPPRGFVYVGKVCK